MLPIPPPEAFDSVLDDDLPTAQRRRRRDIRHNFYALVIGELDGGPLTRRRRSRLLRYARSLGIDRFEAGLLVRGAEYRSGKVPRGPLAGPVTSVDMRYVVASPQPLVRRAYRVLPLGAAVAALWALSRL